MNFLREILRKETTKEISVFIIVAILIYALKNIIDLFLLTFLFTYLIYSLEKIIIVNLRKYIKLKEVFITITLYIIIFTLLIYFVYKYIPLIVNQSVILANGFIGGKSQYSINKVQEYLYPLIGQVDIKGYLKNEVSTIVQFITSLGKWGINIILALVLSLFFMLERTNVRRFLIKFKTSRISIMYKYVVLFWKDFLVFFGKVVQLQMLIAVTNSILSLIMLSVMNFPESIALAFMIFIFSLIPIVGIIMALIPLSIIAFNIGGMIKVIYVISMIVLLYAVENYVLTPQFMSSKTKIPVFFVFIVLIISQHFMGMWGLLVGIPLFMFILHMVGINLNKK
ncbi:membrane protein [Clostridium carboxidivorans P7]|uniref:Permease n=1 Tax=Clostridium carboxidivorans P7 TaxID=536227 RepID=C6Q280_9CLOT|nr:AI-2E family transporter [Clostridium carboxidivorans]AKN33209.1 membrane protein [Clostridium carboxidivorans P7]EET84397.1 protein of unknown function UPF0118 [Clostridium carboxidivorans P7]EFG86910.1 membrane protein, putative [Clostridium carboxidivorans P7]